MESFFHQLLKQIPAPTIEKFYPTKVVRTSKIIAIIYDDVISRYIYFFDYFTVFSFSLFLELSF